MTVTAGNTATRDAPTTTRTTTSFLAGTVVWDGGQDLDGDREERMEGDGGTSVAVAGGVEDIPAPLSEERIIDERGRVVFQISSVRRELQTKYAVRFAAGRAHVRGVCFVVLCYPTTVLFFDYKILC